MASTSTSGRGQQERDPFWVLEPPQKKIKSSLTAEQFDVFINHRGPDTKTKVAQQLYDALQEAGIRAYLDAPETELGDYFPSAIKNVISSAAVHIAILSPQYAESPWCLAELALMFQTKARIIPLFYHVQPSDFRYIKNGVAEAFSKHEGKGRFPSHDIQQWKECLQNVSWLKGYELSKENDDPSELCDDVLSAVVKEKQKRKIPFQVAQYAVGLDELVKDFHSHCQRNGQMRDKIIGIFGMGGSGKTTLAKYLFNSKHSEFSGSASLFDVRESHVKGNLTSLQSKLLNDLFPGNHYSFSSIEEGTAYIKHELQGSHESRFLIVIDDVDHQKQLDALLPKDTLNPNSLVIVTTRDERLLIKFGATVRYKMKEMNPEHSKELFCWHAFHTQSCQRGFENLVDSFVEACGGLPLALQVMGGHVFGSGMAYWKLQLDKAKARLDKDIRDTLKISYDALEEDQKQIFMDIACFFTGEDERKAISIWKASGWRAEHALQTLKDKCLIEVQDEVFAPVGCHYEPTFVLKMHDHLRDLGREMADKETVQPTDNQMSHPRRLWRPEDLIGMRKIKGFQGTLAGSEGKSFRCFINRVDIEDDFYMRCFLGSTNTSTDLQVLELSSIFGHRRIPEYPIPLQNLHTLSLERVSPVILWQRDDQVLLKLKELSCIFDSILDSSLQNMYMSDFKKLLSSLGMFKNLRSLQIECGPEFLRWESIIEWNRLQKSIRELTYLQTLSLKSFKVEGEFALSNRGKTTVDLFPMRNLEAIILCGVLKTTVVSISGQFCPNLKSLQLCCMTDLIEMDLTGITTLECLSLLKCQQLRKVLGNDLLKLEFFNIKLCPTMREFPNFGGVNCLKRIYISQCENLQDVSAFERLERLKRIWIAYCPELKSIKAIEHLKGLKRLWIQGCTQLHDVVCFNELKELKKLFIGKCTRMQNMEGIEHLLRLESIIITECPKLTNIRGVEELEGLKEMIISDSPIISCVERLQRLPSEHITMVGRSAMSDFISNEGDEDEDEEGFRFGYVRRSSISYFTADKIGNTLSMVDAFYEIEREGNINNILDWFHKTHRSLSTFIFCALVWDSPQIEGDVFNGTRIVRQRPHHLRHINLFSGAADWIYMCVVNEERFSEYDSWIPSSLCIKKAFIMGVKAGEERKTLHVLQSLFAKLCIHNS
ncbi:disease resistance protein Roq1-like [Cryptomeria japonica]|uniref:disease resistance protein Roq1-like n=1 Tax=Cryptomeria japonica TaxID=3369 RepID=UPI0025ABE8B8|nr:disease resistance protein Roq1-like [Cryptomeria japonica]